jgi:hypothetical protein
MSNHLMIDKLGNELFLGESVVYDGAVFFLVGFINGLAIISQEINLAGVEALMVNAADVIKAEE